MKGFFAERVDTGKREFVWFCSSPAYGTEFDCDGVRYRRPLPAGHTPPRPVICRGKDADFSRGPVTMWSEPLEGRHAVRAPHYDKNGFAVFASNKEIREYRAASQDSKRPVEWTR